MIEGLNERLNLDTQNIIPNTEKVIYIIRHGETELNKLGIVQGRGVDSDLNEMGRNQSEAFYQHYKNTAFDKIYTSSLKRTRQTVQKFIDKGLPWEAYADLDELAWGEWEGKINTEESRAAFRDVAEQWKQGDYSAHFEGGESPQDVFNRLTNVVELIKKRLGEKAILVCMHGRAMRILLCLLTGKPLKEMADFPHQNTTLYKISMSNNQFQIVDFNNTEHLKAI